jgi:hypothetical protein
VKNESGADGEEKRRGAINEHIKIALKKIGLKVNLNGII